METSGEWKKFPEVYIAKDEDLGRVWTAAASKQVREAEHKTDFGSMKDRWETQGEGKAVWKAIHRPDF